MYMYIYIYIYIRIAYSTILDPSVSSRPMYWTRSQG